MAKKYYSSKNGGFGTEKNDFANMPQEKMMKKIPKNSRAMQEGGYCDTMESIDMKHNSAVKTIKKIMKK